MDENPTIRTSPISEVTSERFKGDTYIQENVYVVGVARVVLLPHNPNRLFWIAINESANDVRLSTDPNITAASGWVLAGSGGVISMYWEEDGESVCYDVFAISGVAGQNVRIREVIRS